MSTAVTVAVVTIFWLCVGFLGPLVVYFGNKWGWFKMDPHTGVIIVMLVLTAVCCWLFWFLAFLAQYKPLIGPTLPVESACIVQCQWFNHCSKDIVSHYCPRYS